MIKKAKRAIKRSKRFIHELLDEPPADPGQSHQSQPSSVLESEPESEFTGWTGLKRLAAALDKSVEGFGPLKEATGILVSCIHTFEAAASNRKEYKDLRTELDSLFSEIEGYISAPVSLTMTSSIKNLAQCVFTPIIRLKSSLNPSGQRNQKETTFIETMREQGGMSRYVYADRQADEILACYRRIQGLLQRLMLNTTLDIRKEVNDIATEGYLQRLPNSRSAYYRSPNATTLRRGGCTPDTRVDVLKDLHDWTRSPTDKKIYWMNGMAGTGKTTIAYSLCKELEKNETLAASFFCSRQIPECRNVNRIIPTIAYQLSRFSSPYRRAICAVLKDDPDVDNKPVLDQFEHLVVGPLRKVKDTLPTDLVVVIDALDECDAETGVSDILDTVLLHSSDLPVKFFISSRPDVNILAYMRQKQGERVTTEMKLHELSKTVVQMDIRTYLETELMPHLTVTEDQMELLVARSGVLFIYAATVVRYIKAQGAARGSKRLAEVLKSSGSSSELDTKTIDALYTTILTTAFGDDVTQSDSAEMLLILHTIICACEPMSERLMADFLMLESEQSVRASVQPLFSVLQVSDVITTLHESFRDYLLDKKRSGKFTCNPVEHHTRLAALCFGHIGASVSFNICDIKSSYIEDKNQPELDDRINKMIPEQLFYSSRYWDAHVVASDRSEGIASKLLEFLTKRLLLWMEIMNLKNVFAHGARMIYDVEIIARDYRWLNNDARALLRDCWEFMSSCLSESVLKYPNTAHLCICLVVLGSDPKPEATIDAGSAVLSTGYSNNGAYVVSGSYDNTVRIWDARTGKQVGQPLDGHTSAVWSVGYSPDGAYIVSGSSDKTVRIWDARTGKQVGQPLDGHTSAVWSVGYSPDGAYIVSGSSDNTVRIWDARTGKQVGQPLDGHTSAVRSVGYSPDGAYIVSGSEDNTVRIWDARTGKQVGQPLDGHTSAVYSVVYSPDGAYIVSGSSDNTVRIWDARTGKQVAQSLDGHTSGVYSVVYSPDGAYIVSGSSDNTVRIWDARTGKQPSQLGGILADGAYIVSGSWDKTVRIWDARTGKQVGQSLDSHTSAVLSTGYSNNGAYVVSGSDDNTVRIWDARTGKQVGQSLDGHTSAVWSVGYSPDGAYIVSGSSDNTVRIWDARTGKQVAQSLDGHTSGVYSVVYSPDGAYIVSGSSDNTVRIWDARTGKQVGQSLDGHTSPVNSVGYSPDGAYIVSGSWDKTVRIWDARTGKQRRIIYGYSNNGAYVVSGSDDNTVRIWDARTGKQVGQSLDGHTSAVWSVGYSPDGAYIVSGSGDKTVRIWDARTGKQVGQPLDGHTSPILSVRYSPDGAYIVSGSGDKTVRIWDARTGKQVGQPLDGHTSPVLSVRYSPDGAYIVSGSLDNTVRIWDARTGKQVGQPLDGHTSAVWSVGYSPDGAYIVSGSNDKTVRIWDARTGKQVGQSLDGHTSAVRSVGYSPDGAYIVSGSEDNTVRIWDARTGKQVGQSLDGHTSLVSSVGYSSDGAYIVSGSWDNHSTNNPAGTQTSHSLSSNTYSNHDSSSVQALDSRFRWLGGARNWRASTLGPTGP
ncbi:Notchless protein [Ceratobasidium sp. AG-Ba]|nr:Notchless protein [Ceratobasidium sp. AG-Ba]